MSCEETEDPLRISDQICSLCDDDIQCGKIFYSSTSRILKYFCTYCGEFCSDDINNFGQHYSAHIDEIVREHVDESQEECIEEFLDEVAEEQIESNSTELTSMVENLNTDETIALSCDSIEHHVVEQDSQVEFLEEYITNNSNEIENESDLEQIQLNSPISELSDNGSDSVSASAGVGECSSGCEESTKFELINITKDGRVTFTPYEYDCEMLSAEESNDSDDENTKKSNKKIPNANKKFVLKISDKKNFVTEKRVSTRSRKKKKRITTIKVIAVKNKVDNLYKQIEEIEEYRRNGGVIPENSRANIEQQIIGETLVTNLPDPDKKDPTGRFQRPYECIACGARFRSAFSLTIHNRTHFLETSNSIKVAHKCSNCVALFSTMKSLKDHVKNVHYPNGYDCNFCLKNFASVPLLESHLRKKHWPKPFGCEICKKAFATPKALEFHKIEIHEERMEKNYKCRICGRKYSLEMALEEHMKHHKEPQAQCCVVCGKITFRITQHMKIHTPRPKRILNCKYCGKTFSYSSGLSHHIKVAHKLGLPQKIKQKTKQINQKMIKNEIEEQLEMHKTIETSMTSSSIPAEENIPVIDKTLISQSSKIDDVNSNIFNNDHDTNFFNDIEVMHRKEEEAKRVIVELIQNSVYHSYGPPVMMHDVEGAPPIAREETISAVDSITNDNCLYCSK